MHWDVIQSPFGLDSRHFHSIAPLLCNNKHPALKAWLHWATVEEEQVTLEQQLPEFYYSSQEQVLLKAHLSVAKYLDFSVARPLAPAHRPTHPTSIFSPRIAGINCRLCPEKIRFTWVHYLLPCHPFKRIQIHREMFFRPASMSSVLCHARSLPHPQSRSQFQTKSLSPSPPYHQHLGIGFVSSADEYFI